MSLMNTVNEWEAVQNVPLVAGWGIRCGEVEIVDTSLSKEIAGAICEEHNAAVEAERMKRGDWNVVIEDLEKALAAERERLEYYENQEREIFKVTANVTEAEGSMLGRVTSLYEQLLAAQAAIAEMRSLCLDVKLAVMALVHPRLQPSWESKFDRIFKMTVDLSALKEHDEEVRKPLVYALKRVAEWHSENG